MSASRIVIIADDDVPIRETLASILGDAGYETRTARDGTEALLLLDGLRSTPCLLILDLMMPVMSGFEVLDVLTRAHRLARLPVIVCSAVMPEHPLPGGVRHFIRKPVSLDVLLSAIEDLCQDEGPIAASA